MSDSPTAQGVGASALRKEDERFLRGRGQYVGDIRLPNPHDVAFVRSALAHGLIKAIHVPVAYRDRVFIAQDLKGVRIRAVSGLKGFKALDQPALATGKVRQVGELIAMCVAPTRAEAEDIAAQVRLDLKELPAVHDIIAACLPGAPLMHEEWGDNVFLETLITIGIEKAFDAPIRVSREISTARQCMAPIEGRGVVAAFDDSLDQLTLHSATQTRRIGRNGRSECLGVEQGRIRIVAPDVGGGFGYKGAIRVGLSGNLRRCTAYVGMANAVKEVIAARRAHGIAAIPGAGRVALGPVGAHLALDESGDRKSPAEKASLPIDRSVDPAQAVAPLTDFTPTHGFEHSFSVSEAPERVFAHFIDVKAVAAPTPGLTLTIASADCDEGSFVALGAVTAHFRGQAQICRDAARLCGRILATGGDAASRSRAPGAIDYRVRPSEAGTGSIVALHVGYSLSGHLGQLGRRISSRRWRGASSPTLPKIWSASLKAMPVRSRPSKRGFSFWRQSAPSLANGRLGSPVDLGGLADE